MHRIARQRGLLALCAAILTATAGAGRPARHAHHGPAKKAPTAAPGSVPVAGTFPNALEIGDSIARGYNNFQAMRLCGDIGPPCPAARAPEVRGVSCRGDEHAATCSFLSRHAAEAPWERCTGTFGRPGPIWVLDPDSVPSNSVPPQLHCDPVDASPGAR
jgi:hypothetical protein